jgi:hypothetical protein
MTDVDIEALFASTLEVKGPASKFRVAEAASLMLGMQSDRDDWGADEHCAALEARFPKSK